ncbi:MAG: hypothetical protein ACKVX7_04470 [Planctomycetota bacterium]
MANLATHRNITAALLLVPLAFCAQGCGGGGGGGGGVAAPPPSQPPELSTEIVYERNRDPVTAQIEPVLSESAAGFDGTEVDSPAVAIDSGRPNGDKFLLFYEATSGGGVSTIGVVSSDEEDFATLTIPRTQAIALGGPASGFNVGATDPTVVVDKSVPFGVTGRYHMWFEGRSGAGGLTSQIIHATSGNGETWGNFQICLGFNASFGSVRVADPSAVLDGTTFKMWFEAIDVTAAGGGDGPASIGYAESSDGFTWLIRDAHGQSGGAASPVFLHGPAQQFDGYSVGSPSVVLDPTIGVGANGRFKMWYEAGDREIATQNSMGYAMSADGIVWNDPTLPIFLPSSDSIVPLPFDSGDIEHPCAAIIETVPAATVGHFLLWYTGDGENGASPNRIGLARGRNGP